MKSLVSILEVSNIKKRDKWEKYLSKKEMSEEIKPWYHRKYPTDEAWVDLIDDANFSDVLKLLLSYPAINIDNTDYTIVDDLTAGDSIVRERVFDKIAQICKCKYDDIYRLWLNR